MRVDPRVIDLGWGQLKSAILTLKDSAFASPAEAAAGRQALMGQYVAAFRQVEQGATAQGATSLKELSTTVAARVAPDARGPLEGLVNAQRAKVG